MGMGLAYIAGGLLQGAGQGLADQGKLMASQRWEQWKLQQAQAYKQQEMDQQFRLNDQLDERRQGRMGEREKANDERTIGGQVKVQETRNVGDIEQEKIRGTNALLLENMRFGNDISKIEKKAAVDLANDLEKAGIIADHTAITSDGKIAFYNAKGDLLRVGVQQGQFNPPNAPKEEAADGLEGRLGRGGRKVLTPKKSVAEAPADQPAEAAAADPAQDQRLRAIWTRATPETMPRLFENGAKMTFEEFKRAMGDE